MFANGLATAMINSCNSCTVAWLYKDAHKFGIDAYKQLVGSNNAFCPDVGPVLETDDADFIAQMNSCPCTCLFFH